MAKQLPELQNIWRQPPPGTEVVTSGMAMEGDFFYIEQFGVWTAVPRKFWGTPIAGRLVARGTLDVNNVKILEVSA